MVKLHCFVALQEINPKYGKLLHFGCCPIPEVKLSLIVYNYPKSIDYRVMDNEVVDFWNQIWFPINLNELQNIYFLSDFNLLYTDSSKFIGSNAIDYQSFPNLVAESSIYHTVKEAAQRCGNVSDLIFVNQYVGDNLNILLSPRSFDHSQITLKQLLSSSALKLRQKMNFFETRTLNITLPCHNFQF